NFSAGKWSSATRVLADLSKNRYNYFLNDSVIAKQTHAETKQYAFMQDLDYRVNSKQQAGLHIWLQDAQRQVPYTLSEIKQDAGQHDKIFRAMLDWKLNKSKYSVTAKTAFFNEALIYNNQTYFVYSNSVFKTGMADIEGQLYLPKGFTITGGSTNSVSMASSEGYEKQQQISRMALYQNISWKNKNISASVYGREEYFNFNTFVPTAGANGAAHIFTWLALKVNAGTVYRYPTLNDLYWNPGGNPSLKPEQGYSAETSLQLNKQIKTFSFLVNGTIFDRSINNCIVWLPGKNGVWTPQNILQVWSRGGETNTEMSFKGKKIATSITVITNYVLSSRTQTALQNDESVNRQMPYVPMYSGSAIYCLEFKNWLLRVAYAYTGYRYLTSDNYQYLAPYLVLDARISKTFLMKNMLLNIFAEGNNLLNENYQSVTQYPMPLRNFKAGMIIQYQKQNKKQNI
ncbi:MAG TPA: TonB-dependent receptor, partial [Bacteroidia bacterium]|nr:TonB-dependent receptor [Bacteroidia bacterium]